MFISIATQNGTLDYEHTYIHIHCVFYNAGGGGGGGIQRTMIFCYLSAIELYSCPWVSHHLYKSVIFWAPRWYIGPTLMPRVDITPIVPSLRSGAIGCDSRPRHCRGDEIPAWRPNKVVLLSLLPLNPTMYRRFIIFTCCSVPWGRQFSPRYCL